MSTIFLIVGKSGSGKTTLVNRLKDMGSAVESYTTRPKRTPDETGHTFITEDEFKKLTHFVGYTYFDGYHYGAVQEQIDESLFYIIDPLGYEFFKGRYHGNKQVKVVYIEAPLFERLKRLTKRDRLKKAIARVWHDTRAFKDFKKDADYVITNTDLYTATYRLHRLVKQVEWEEYMTKKERFNEN